MSVNLPRPEGLSGVKKAAILLVSLGEDISAELLRQLAEDEVQLISREIARMNSVTSELAEGVVDEFEQVSLSHEYARKGGMDDARKVLVATFGQDSAKRVLDRLQ